MATENEIRALTAEELRALQADKSQMREVTQPVVRYPPDLNPLFVMPDQVDLRRLFYLVTMAHPQLAPQGRDEGEALKYFGYAFFRIGSLGHVDKLETKYAVSWWADEATWWLKDRGVNLIRLTSSDFTIAAIAHYDVGHGPVDNFPHGCAFGLNPGRWGRPASDAWRRLLETRTVRPPVVIALQRPQPQPTVYELVPPSARPREPW
jgi:hypothetical protein